MCSTAVSHNHADWFHCSIDRELDSRIEKNERDDGFKSKQKSPSSSSSVLGPPPDAPDWAVQTV